MDDDGMWLQPGRVTAGDGARSRLARVAGSLEASPAEVLGLTLLLLGGVLCLGILVWWSRPAVDGAVAVAQPTAADVAGLVTIHVVGAVGRPGVVQVPATARVVDAVEAAGGATVLADLDGLNLARTVADGERIEVPERGAGGAAPTSAAEDSGAFGPDGRLDLNRATAAELETLPGIGPVLAQRILEHREANGPFGSAGALREVPGIGERSFQRLADLVFVP